MKCFSRVMNRALGIETNKLESLCPQRAYIPKEDQQKNKAENNVLDTAKVCAEIVNLKLNDTVRGRQAIQCRRKEEYSEKPCKVNPRVDCGGTSAL